MSCYTMSKCRKPISSHSGAIRVWGNFEAQSLAYALFRTMLGVHISRSTDERVCLG
jgi:hypothetical protein